MNEEQIIVETIRTFRQRRIEPIWDHLNLPARDRYLELWSGLDEIGASALSAEQEGLSVRARLGLLAELGAAVPALAFGLIAHHAALSLFREAAARSKRSSLLEEGRFFLIGSPLDPSPESSLELSSNGSLCLSGSIRAAWPYPDWLVLCAREQQRARLVAVRADAPGLRFAARTSSHGLRLIPFGELSFDRVPIAQEEVFDWPASGRAAREADGLLTAVFRGLVREMHQRAMAYALTRYQGGKMIHEHDAVQNLVGPMLVAERALEALAIATLEAADVAGDGGASAFAIEHVRSAGLDAIQTFGGYGYMEDYRVERYLRDANTFETFWVQAAKRRRAIAVRRFHEIAS